MMAPLTALLHKIRAWYWKSPAPAATRPITTQEVLREEAEAIHGVDLAGRQTPDLYRALNQLGQSALCLSGGGIRSAAFALGVIQALAAHPRTAKGDPIGRPERSLLAKFHFLSTVSGGGYIGSWLSAWRARADFETVWRNLVGRPQGPDNEPATIGWLRSYSNYLTPQLGVMSADTWALVSVYVRNLVLNWLVILPVICAAILLLKFFVVILAGLANLEDSWLPPALFAVAGVGWLLAALSFTTSHRPSRQGDAAAAAGEAAKVAGLPAFLRRHLIWSLCSAIALTQALGTDTLGNLFEMKNAAGGLALNELTGLLVPRFSKVEFVGSGALIGALIYGLGWIIGWPKRREFSDFAFWAASGLVYGALVGFGFYLYLLVPDEMANGEASVLIAILNSPTMYLTIGVPWILAAQWAADLLFVGLTSYQRQFNADQEWLARAAGWRFVTGVAWTLGMFLTFAGFLPGIDSNFTTDIYLLLQYGVVIFGLAGLAIALFGSSSLSRFNVGAKGIIAVILNLALAIAAPLFVGALIFSLSIGLDHLLLGRHLFAIPLIAKIVDGPDAGAHDYTNLFFALQWLFVGLAVAVIVDIYASRRININRFSLHALYRNRLIRAFLGASRERTPNPFTGFDEADSPRLHELWPARGADGKWPKRSPTDWRPFHVVNMTMNIVSAKRLAWQERKAAPFTVSPLHCGTSSRSYPLGKESGNVGDLQVGAYRPSQTFGGAHGLSLGTAMAISGAAASPNMGYHSSPSVTFLMTMFNVRLGWWLGNPGPEGALTFTHDGPAVAIRPLVEETFGLTTDNSKYVHVSDGGHFENLGLYEMVRRRCRFILISDVGRDPDFAFEDLGNAVRKIEIDFGIPIRFHKLEALRSRPAESDGAILDGDYHAIGEIDYQCADGSLGVDNGVIVYVKAGYHGTESAGVRSYAMANFDFPHQSTANQWFSESQFESYRSLGFEIMDGLLNKALQNEGYNRNPSLEKLGAALSGPVDPASSRHLLKTLASAVEGFDRPRSAPPERKP
jgi:hypothetical protein